VLLAFGCFPVQCCANSAVGHFMLVKGKRVCFNSLEVTELVTARVCGLSIPAEFHVVGVHLCETKSVCLCNILFGVPCATESCIRNPKFSTHTYNQWAMKPPSHLDWDVRTTLTPGLVASKPASHVE
jgi:hypothetical protein